MPKQNQEPGPERSTAAAAFDDLRQEIAQRKLADPPEGSQALGEHDGLTRPHRDGGNSHRRTRSKTSAR